MTLTVSRAAYDALRTEHEKLYRDYRRVMTQMSALMLDGVGVDLSPTVSNKTSITWWYEYLRRLNQAWYRKVLQIYNPGEHVDGSFQTPEVAPSAFANSVRRWFSRFQLGDVISPTDVEDLNKVLTAYDLPPYASVQDLKEYLTPRLIHIESVLSLLEHRGILDTRANREDVSQALATIRQAQQWLENQ